MGFLIFTDQLTVLALAKFRDMRRDVMDVQIPGEQIVEFIAGA